MVRTNVEAVVALTGHYLPEMAGRGRGAVLNVASLIAFQPVPFQATYGATKAFVLSFTDALHEEMRGTGVTVTARLPGPGAHRVRRAGRLRRRGRADPRRALARRRRRSPRTRSRRSRPATGVTVPGAGNQLAALWGQHLPRSVLLPLVKRLWPVS